MSANDRPIAFLDFALLEKGPELGRGFRTERKDNRPRATSVQAMNRVDPAIELVTQVLLKTAIGVRGNPARVNQHSRWLVDDDEVRGLKKNSDH